MKKKMNVLLALVLALCVLLAGCIRPDFSGYFQRLQMLLGGGSVMTDFNDMVYTRPDVAQLQSVVDQCCDQVASAGSLEEVVDIIYEAYAAIDAFSTAYALSNIYYCKDLTDTYWAGEYAYCSENLATFQAMLDQFYRALAKCSFREELEGDNYFGAGFFDDYEGESVYDEVFMDLLTQEANLESEYYAMWNAAGDMDPYSEDFHDQYGVQMEQLFVELILVRQEIATYLGYESYSEFAYSYYYGRTYTVEQTTSYLADIRAELVPLYASLGDLDIQLGASNANETLSYVREMATAMGGTVQTAFETMVNYHLYDISYGANKYNASFETYISGYYSPYVFINPSLSDYDKLTLAHEFGHFCCDFVSGGSAAGVDVGEVFSQGMEYLSLCYVSQPGDLETVKMVDCLCVMVEQAAYASFEQQVYDLQGDELTVENVRALYAQVSSAFGLDTFQFDSRNYVQITHFFTNPMYVISYVVSNDVAFQLYQLEQAQAGAGLAVMQRAFTTAHSDILAFAREYGLESPFADGRIISIRETLRKVLN